MFKTAYLSVRKGNVGVRERATETEVLSQAGTLVFRRLLHCWLCHSMRQPLSKASNLLCARKYDRAQQSQGAPPFWKANCEGRVWRVQVCHDAHLPLPQVVCEFEQPVEHQQVTTRLSDVILLCQVVPIRLEHLCKATTKKVSLRDREERHGESRAERRRVLWLEEGSNHCGIPSRALVFPSGP